MPLSWLYNLLVPLFQRTLRQQLNKQVSAALLLLVALALCPQPSQELGDPILGLLPDALLCFQLCVELEKSISRMEASLKRMRGGSWGRRAGGWCPEGSVGPL